LGGTVTSQIRQRDVSERAFDEFGGVKLQIVFISKESLVVGIEVAQYIRAGGPRAAWGRRARDIC